MGLGKWLVIVFCFLVFSLNFFAFSQNVQAIKDELTQARKKFIAERDKLHDQDRILRINWHKEREELYQQAKNNPQDKTIKERITQGQKKFLADKEEIYRKLEQLRKDWLKTRKELGKKIKEIEG